MEYNELPFFVRESVIFTEEEKRLLASINNLPSELEVDRFRIEPQILELTNAFIGDESTRGIHLQERAKEYLAQNDIKSAWKVLLL